MSHEQRTMIAKTVFDLANLVSIALVFGQFASSQAFSIKVFLLGIMVTSSLYTGGFILSMEKGGDEKNEWSHYHIAVAAGTGSYYQHCSVGRLPTTEQRNSS
jgi:hypothetical protein